MMFDSKILLLLCIFCFVSCNENDATKNAQANTIVSASPPSIDELLKLYQPIEFDTLYVVSEIEDTIKNRYKGTAIPPHLYPILQEVQEEDDVSWEGAKAFACYKFQLDKPYIGLITRTPSEYESSSVRIYVLNTDSKHVTDVFELAESWGDAGDSMVKDSWLYFNSKKELEWIFNRTDCSYDEKDSLECWNNYDKLYCKQGKIQSIPFDSTKIREFIERKSK